MKNFADFLKANKEKIYEHAERNTQRNKNGEAVISRDDAWFDEDEWDDIGESALPRRKPTVTGTLS